MVFPFLLIFKSSSTLTNPISIEPSGIITISIPHLFMFHVFFRNLVWSRCLLLFSLSFIRNQWFTGSAKSIIRHLLSLFMLTIARSGCRPRFGDLFVSQNFIEIYASPSLGQILGCAYTTFFIIKFQFLAQFPVDHLSHPVVSSLILFLL